MVTPRTIRQPLVDELDRRTRELEQRTSELRASEARFRNIIERNADAIVVVDRDGLLQFANAEAGKLFGSRPEQLVGSPFGFPLVTGETTELDLLRPEGARAVEMRVVESQWEGCPALIATLRDVTERNREEQNARRLIREQAARAATEEALHRFRFLADSGMMLSASLDPQKTLRDLAHLCVSELAEWAVIYLVDDAGEPRRFEVAHRDPAMAELAHALRELEIESTPANPLREVLRTRRPGIFKQVAAEQFAETVRDEKQRAIIRRLGLDSFVIVPMIARTRVLGAISLVRTAAQPEFSEADLETASHLATRAALALDTVRLYEEARFANQTKSDLLAVISHDLRTPLNSIIGYVQLLQMGLPEPLPAGCLERVERISLSARHLLHMIDGLLAFARLESGRDELHPVESDVRALVQEVGSVLEPLAFERGLRLRIETPARAMPFRTDPDKLRQILLNIVGNAVKYTNEGEVALCASEQADGSIQLRVSDTGIGIAREHLEHIFEPFWQVDRSQRNSGGGTGLGLSIVRRVVHQLGGVLEVFSDPGRGSTFAVTLKSDHSSL